MATIKTNERPGTRAVLRHSPHVGIQGTRGARPDPRHRVHAGAAEILEYTERVGGGADRASCCAPARQTPSTTRASTRPSSTSPTCYADEGDDVEALAPPARVAVRRASASAPVTSRSSSPACPTSSCGAAGRASPPTSPIGGRAGWRGPADASAEDEQSSTARVGEAESLEVPENLAATAGGVPAEAPEAPEDAGTAETRDELAAPAPEVEASEGATARRHGCGRGGVRSGRLAGGRGSGRRPCR